jgi:hypothetical protein
MTRAGSILEKKASMACLPNSVTNSELSEGLCTEVWEILLARRFKA